MPDDKPRYANFPERDLKVVIGPNISASSAKTLTRLSIGTYEMSVAQQEKGSLTSAAARAALNTLAKAQKLVLSHKPDREFTTRLVAEGSERRITLWVTTPFELGQSAHLVWVKYEELDGEMKTGVAFKLATAFTIDDMLGVVKTAEKNAVKIDTGEPYILKGNPPPRFQKKVKVDEAPAAAAPAPAAAES